jgi:hypothetical protein
MMKTFLHSRLTWRVFIATLMLFVAIGAILGEASDTKSILSGIEKFHEKLTEACKGKNMEFAYQGRLGRIHVRGLQPYYEAGVWELRRPMSGLTIKESEILMQQTLYVRVVDKNDKVFSTTIDNLTLYIDVTDYKGNSIIDKKAEIVNMTPREFLEQVFSKEKNSDKSPTK